ncbi:hypothetical protein SASPL_138210 [Salvia splendens]|uniref:Myb/SANT-like domain-containing protein n=1 Tax=Salvia splendens TaxID=180675 RepID=A0A8X8WWN2_SALSN|nr:uncharacterized protein LOC121764668 [Salvia splendens]KAG6401356.1 hypothetical protein SASPL_138210 [Salvia splendens]
MTAASEIGSQVGVQFNEAELAIRVKIMSIRYRTFKEVVNHPGMYWDKREICIFADGCVWTKFLLKHPFAAAYHYYDKPEYSKIRCLFGIDDVKEDSHTDLISIPSSSDADSSEDSGCYEVAPDNEEVNSPAVFPKPTVRCKLFDDDVEAIDRESTTAKGIYWIDVGPDENLRTRLKKSRTLPKDPFIKNDGEDTL